MKEKKYKLTDETIIHNHRTLYRIEALRDFSDVKKGDKGGFIEKESNLSHYGDCWVYDDAKVFSESNVFEDARIYENSQVFGNAIIHGWAKIYGYCKIYEYSEVYGYAEVCDYAKVFDNAEVYGYSEVRGRSQVCGYSEVYGYAEILGDAVIQSKSDYLVFQNNWSSGRFFTWTRSNNMWRVGCFYGTGQELIKKAYKDSTNSGKKYEAFVKMVESTFLND